MASSGIAQIINQPSNGISAGLLSPVSAVPSFASFFNGSLKNLAPGGIAPIAIGTPPALTPGVPGQSLSYISTQGGGVSGLSLLVPLTPKMTIFFTVKIPEPTSQGSQSVILDSRGTINGYPYGGPYLSFNSEYNGGSPQLQLWVGCPTNANYTNVAFSQWGQWVTFAVTIDQSGGNQIMRVYNLTSGQMSAPGADVVITPVTANGIGISLGTSNDGDGQNGTAQIAAVWAFPDVVLGAADMATVYARFQQVAAYGGTSV